MKNKYIKRPVQITNVTTGETRMSEPMPVYAPAAQGISAEVSEQSALNPATETTPTSAEGEMISSALDGLRPEASQSEAESTTATPESGGVQAAPEGSGKSNAKGKGKGAAASKPKVSIETLEQFIAHAFVQKGRRIRLDSKTERLIARSPRLADATMNALFALSDLDTRLAVPRQLLLVSREVGGFPALREALKSFVAEVMLRHPIFADADLRAVVRNLPAASGAELALKRVANYMPPSTEGNEALKPAELQELRRNAWQLLVTWLATSRGLNLEALANLLFQAVWSPAARELDDDNARLRALTEIEHSAGVGVACEKFRQNVIDAGFACDQAQRESAGLREVETELRLQLQQVETERNALTNELQELKVNSTSELADARKQHEVERTHLRHDQEQLRGRLIRRLGDSIEMLEVGLTALRNKTPRTEVMVERAEHVIDALRAEDANLKEE